MARGDNNNRSRALPLAEVARLLRRSRGFLANAISDGMPATPVRGARGTPEWRLDVAAVVGWLEAKAVDAERERLEAKHAQDVERLQRALEAAEGDASEPISRSEALRRRAVAEMRLREIDLAEREASVMPCDAINRALVTIMVSTRDRLLALPTRIAPELAADSTVRGCGQLLDAAINETLHDIADLGEQAEELLERGEDAVPAELEAKVSQPARTRRRESMADADDGAEPEEIEA
ncbi:MAG: hypothetical protein ACREI7_03610, partial [Myxococcota bacterium]